MIQSNCFPVVTVSVPVVIPSSRHYSVQVGPRCCAPGKELGKSRTNWMVNRTAKERRTAEALCKKLSVPLRTGPLGSRALECILRKELGIQVDFCQDQDASSRKCALYASSERTHSAPRRQQGWHPHYCYVYVPPRPTRVLLGLELFNCLGLKPR